MFPFSLSLRSGDPIYEQVISAVRRAVVTGQRRAGDGFPSVRGLSQELRVNPNTAHRIVATLVDDGLLEVRPGIGTVVGEGKRPAAAVRRELLEHDAERLVVEARRGGLSLEDVVAAIRRHWSRTVHRKEKDEDEEVRR
jgi:GntR family transcriptional regulator